MIENQIKICGHGGNTPSVKLMGDYNTTRYKQVASNGVHKGVVAVMRHKKMTGKLRKLFHDTYKTILGRNKYSQIKREFVYNKYKDGVYYSDCSSSGMATYEKIGLNIGSYYLNTAGIFKSSLFKPVKVKIVNGHIFNPEKLKVGDCILYAGSDPSRPMQIGHVEYVYEIEK